MLAHRHLGRDPFELFHYGREELPPGGLSGRPKRPKRYKTFLYACAAVAHDMQMQASGATMTGTSAAPPPPHDNRLPGRPHSGR